MLRVRIFKNALQAMDYFAVQESHCKHELEAEMELQTQSIVVLTWCCHVHQRTRDGKGVIVPSQRKYVEYYDLYLRYQELGLKPPIGSKSSPICIEKITVHGLSMVCPCRLRPHLASLSLCMPVGL